VSDLRLDGKVAIVTGAGRGLGRAYALLLADRGARVVVNDIGSSKEGVGRDQGPAAAVAEEIRRRGGDAVPNVSSVADEAEAGEIVSCATAEFGRLDIVVNNAGILQAETFPGSDISIFERVLRVNLFGSYFVTRAAWPHLVKVAGRVVMTTSAALFGSPPLPAYATAKAGVLGMARSFALLGDSDGVKVNVICPTASTRMIGDPAIRSGAGIPTGLAPRAEGRGEPDAVAPLVLLLAHDACPVTGEILASNGLSIARIFTAVSRPVAADTSASAIAARLDALDGMEVVVPTSGAAYLRIRSEQS
jgi:NAD(P)-dependent dehydrogenase (short-subunit alcohol dehydrogenase family)